MSRHSRQCHRRRSQDSAVKVPAMTSLAISSRVMLRAKARARIRDSASARVTPRSTITMPWAWWIGARSRSESRTPGVEVAAGGDRAPVEDDLGGDPRESRRHRQVVGIEAVRPGRRTARARRTRPRPPAVGTRTPRVRRARAPRTRSPATASRRVQVGDEHRSLGPERDEARTLVGGELQLRQGLRVASENAATPSDSVVIRCTAAPVTGSRVVAARQTRWRDAVSPPTPSSAAATPTRDQARRLRSSGPAGGGSVLFTRHLPHEVVVRRNPGTPAARSTLPPCRARTRGVRSRGSSRPGPR